MTDRTFQQYAQGYGSIPCQVVCQIDGNTVYNGPVTTVDEPLPSLPNTDYTVDNIAWTWSQDASFDGTKSVSIAVDGSPLLLATTLANGAVGNTANTFGFFYSVEIDGIQYKDPFTDEAIDGIAQTGPYDVSLPGQWWWTIPAGSTFTATMHVNAPPTPE